MHLFYCPDLTDSIIRLPDDEAHHIFHVLRLNAEAQVMLTDGKGTLLTARLTEVSKKMVMAEKEEKIAVSPRKFSLHIAIAPPKNSDRFEWFLEKATEIGIEKITPLLCQRSERKEIKPERLEKLMVAAAKQSQRAFFPQLEPMITFQSFIQEERSGNKFIAHCIEAEKMSFKSMINTTNDATILIGPEGDFSPSEIENAIRSGFKPLSLGESRLRTETAALVACTGFALFTEA